VSRPFKLLLVGDSDSQILACEALCRFPEELSVEITINTVPQKGTPESILRRAQALGRHWNHTVEELITHPEIASFDAVGVYLTGSKIAEFRAALNLLPNPQRPLMFCGFNGVVLEKFIEGIYWRLGSDLICLNGPRDQEALQRITASTPFEGQPIALTGLKRNQPKGLLAIDQRPKLMVFSEQVIMPALASDRVRMVRILAGLAERSPNWQVVIKPRIGPGETTFHKVKNHISQTLEQALVRLPTNLSLDYSPLFELLQRARLMATVSSTALFDAMDFGCRPLVMADFGVQRENGSHAFAGSGVWTVLETVENLDRLEASLPEPSQTWLEWMGYSDNATPANLIAELERLKEQQPQQPPQAQAAPTGYPSSGSINFMQLRRMAERAISENLYQEAANLLTIAKQLRPTHRNVARRLQAVRNRNRLMRRVLLMISHRKLR